MIVILAFLLGLCCIAAGVGNIFKSLQQSFSLIIRPAKVRRWIYHIKYKGKYILFIIFFSIKII